MFEGGVSLIFEGELFGRDIFVEGRGQDAIQKEFNRLVTLQRLRQLSRGGAGVGRVEFDARL